MQNFKAYEQVMDSQAIQVTLESANCQVMIAPKSGFKLYSAIYAGKQIMMPTETPLEPSAANGVPILFPFPNRTRNCHYSYNGHECDVKLNGEPHYLHGMAMVEEFTYTYGITADSAWCSGEMHITPETEYFASYPFPCTLKLTYTLTNEELRLDYKVINDGEETLPYGFAIHPYFDKMGDPDSVTITVPADKYYEAEMCMPTGKLLDAVDGMDLSKPKKITDFFFDHVYYGLDSSKTADICYEKLGLTLSLCASDEFKHMVVYTPFNRPGFCLENQTNSTDYINMTNMGVPTANMLEVAPGQEKSGWITCKVK